MKKKILTHILLCALLLTSFTGCKVADKITNVTSNTSDEADDADAVTYRIGICLSEDSEYYNYIKTGFCYAISELFPDENVKCEVQTITPENSGESIMQYFLKNNVDLIFADGTPALSAASIATFETPIVAAGVIDYKTTLHLIGSSWDRTTKRNITGISGSPSVSSQLSMLLETNPEMKRVGILYSAEDMDSIYQNELMESYLNEAGIAWKEYKLTSTTVSSSQYELEEESTSIILPGEVAVASAKEGSLIPKEKIGESSLITGLLSPNSARAPKTSDRWEASFKKTPAKEPVEEDATTKKAKEKENKKLPEIERENKAIIEEACLECDAFYIASESSLSDQIEMISSLANESGVRTLGGDSYLGQYTLVSLYNDPYDMGYRAGKLANRILANEEDPGKIKIGLPSSGAQKLYQDEVAAIYEQTFPKSFQEYDTFMENYVIGSETELIEDEEE